MKLSFKNVTCQFGTQRALDDVSLDLENDEKVLVLIGPSGGGKSTFLRVLGGLLTPTSGTVSVAGSILTPQGLLNHRRANGFVFQSFNLFPHLTARENVALPLEKVHGLTPDESATKALASLARFGLADHAEKLPAQLSGGQQQRVGIARAVAPGPGLLILDEPTSALDPEMSAEVLDAVQALAAEGQQVILSTHSMGFARAAADRVLYLAKGKIIQAAPPKEVFDTDPSPEVSKFLERVMRY